MMKYRGRYSSVASSQGAMMGLSGRGSAASIIAVLLVVALLFGFFPTRLAFAETETSAASAPFTERPSVLLVDSSLGDFEAFKLHWLGDGATEVASKGAVSLLVSENPAWWDASSVSSTDGVGEETDGQTAEATEATEAATEPTADATAIEAATEPTTGAATKAATETSAPPTFLLGSSTKQAIEATDIAWALDEIAAYGANSKTFIVASGASGLQVRLYAEDKVETKQSSRADLVGIAFLGTAHQGYSVAAHYPKLSLWSELAQASGLEAEDVLPGSTFLNELNAASFPNIVKALQIDGQIGDMGFGATDGAAVQSDRGLSDEVSTQVQTTTARATISQEIGLSTFWMPYSKTLDNEFEPVDANLAERLSAMDSYVTSSEVQAQVKEFYAAWFSDGAPVTHISSVLTLDLSGSMLEVLDSGTTRLDAAKAAAQDYMQAVELRSKTSYAVPTDITVLGFNTSANTLATGSDASAQDALNAINARDETDIGKALQASLDTLEGAPTGAEKRILLLSDGASTQGESNAEMMAGSVAYAKTAGIVIDTIAFGTMGESDVEFLEEIAAETGGDFYESTDTYGLKVSFLKAYFTSLGLNLSDSETNPSAQEAVVLGSLDDNTRSLEIGVLADGETPNATLMRDGMEVDAGSYTVQSDEDGLVTIQMEYPTFGEYSLILDGTATRAHIFVVGQLDLFKDTTAVAAADDFSQILLIGALVVLVVAIVVLIIFTQRSKRKSARAEASEKAKTAEVPEKAEASGVARVAEASGVAKSPNTADAPDTAADAPKASEAHSETHNKGETSE